jgi:hypothetical protein
MVTRTECFGKIIASCGKNQGRCFLVAGSLVSGVEALAIIHPVLSLLGDRPGYDVLHDCSTVTGFAVPGGVESIANFKSARGVVRRVKRKAVTKPV